MIRKPLLFACLLLCHAIAVAQVDTAWVRRYDGPGNYSDWANAIAVDDSGNVCVAGYSWGTGSSADYAVIRYRPNGDTAWVRRYNGPGNNWDQAVALAVDAAGNVYVTGQSDQNPTYPYNHDYATVKYSSSGDELWISRYDGPAHLDEYVYAMVLDALGNAYIAGSSTVGASDLDYATVKCRPNGDTGWVKPYNGTGNGYDYCYAVAVDDSGNVFVTGGSIGAGTGMDFLTIKYDSLGNQLWVKRYSASGDDEAKAIGTDGEGNVYVTGYSVGPGTFYDCLTIKYYADGDTAWVRRYNGPANDWDECTAIAVEPSGNVYVTGFSYGVGTGRDYVSIKYDSTGTELWASRYDGPASSTDEASDLAPDYLGNLYVTGFSTDTATFSDYATVKYSAFGDELWVRRYDGPAGGSDEASAVAVDDSLNVYVTGYSWGDGTAGDYATIKYVQSAFSRGDCNHDGVIDLADCIYLLNFLFKAGIAPNPMWVGDCNCDEIVDLGDVVYLLNYLFKGGPAPSC